MTFKSYAQNFEDVLLWRAFRTIPRGFYIDVGAWDPDLDSVTRAFYEAGWSGINIEPVPEMHAALVLKRPRDVNLAVAVMAKPGKVSLHALDGTGLSTTQKSIAQRHEAAGLRSTTIRVPALTLAAICRKHAVADIHFLKIDCEGSERDVLLGADFGNFRPWVVVVEATEPNSRVTNHEAWEPLLSSADYRSVWFDGLNRFYVAAERHADLAQHFSTPPNVFDGFVRWADHSAGSRSREPAMFTVIHADRLIDGTGAAPVADPVLVVADDRIVDVFQGSVPEGAVPDGARTLRFPGCTILPGLIDTHVHLNLPGDGTTLEVAMRESDGVLVATSAFTARRALDAGITTVRDVGGARATVFDLRRALALGHGAGPRVLACGQPITITGGHTWHFGGEADGEDGLRRKVREMAKLGADFIKVMATGGGTVGTLSWLPSYSRAELAALADEAHRMGRTITAHCLCAEATSMVVDAGFDGIEHGGFLVDASGRQEFVPEVADKVARAGVPVTSTLAVGGYMLRVYGAMERRTAAEQAVFDRWRHMHGVNLANFGRMRAAGVTWVAGTDAGWRFTAFDGLPMEMELMQQGGCSAMEAITAGTGLAARVLGVADRIGTLKPGMLADVIAVAGNPLDDLGRLRDLRLVMQAGKVLARNATEP